jgi:hypothetical protein
MFTPNREFRRQYNRLFKRDPMTANLFLLLAELADDRGQVATNDDELSILMGIRFEDPFAHALKGGD